MSYPKNKKEWWELTESQWENLLNMASDQFQMNFVAYEIPGNSESKLTGRTILEEMTYLKENKDPKLEIYFSAIWNLATEKYAYSKPGWSQLCDLCSESYVLYDSI